MATVAIFGAAGFVGATTVERLLEGREHEVRPFIHHTGNAWRLSRLGLELHSVDVCDRERVRQAVAGADCVVNCTLGPPRVMREGLDNLLRESLAAGVGRFIHLSSVSVYGEQPPGSVVREESRPRSPLSDYGAMKLHQDERVMAASRRGLPSILLAPPMISGPYSPFLLRVLAAMRSGRLALLDGGSAPCSLCDVRNLAAALVRAVSCSVADGSRYFVTDECDVTWGELANVLAPLAEVEPRFPSIDRESALAAANPPGPGGGPISTLRTLSSILASPSARLRWKQDPLVRRVYGLATERMPERLAARLRASLSRPVAGARADPMPQFDAYALGVQTRAARHQVDGARGALGYRPELDFVASMRAFSRWYQATHGFAGPDWPLLRELWSEAG